LCVASSKTLLAIDVDVIFYASAAVFDGMFIKMLAIKALFTHPNPSFFVRKGWPWSVNKHCWVLRVASPLFFAVQIAFLTKWMRGYCVFELKPLGRHQIHPLIAHAFTPQFLQLATK